MVFACGRYMDDLALHGFHKGRIFPFWVYDDHIGIGVCQYDVRHFFLCRKGFSCTRHTEDKRISIQEVSAVGDNHIFADDILTVIYAVFMVDFLHTERDKYRKALRCQGTQGVNPPYAERQSRVQTVHLLVFQHRKLAQMLSGCREQGFGIAVKLLFGVGGMHHREDRKHHPLVTGRQIIKELFAFLSLLFHIIGDDRRKVVILVLFSLPVGNIRFNPQKPVFNFSYGFICGNRNNIDGQHHVSV